MQKIMFNDKYGLTQAVLEGRKTQTRRIAYTAGRLRNITVRQAFEEVNKGKACLFDEGKSLAQSAYKLGEIIAIAQKYEDLTFDIDFFRLRSKKGIILGRILFEKGCFNKMFVRAALMPHHIRITNISVERLQDISNGGCLKEGIWRDDNVGLEGPTFGITVLLTLRFALRRRPTPPLLTVFPAKALGRAILMYSFMILNE